ncbi:MAG: 2'-5' RNA ligase family protein, partial [Oryzihumus sp.]
LADLAAICRRVGSVQVTFRRTGWFDGADVLWLDPEPAAPFVSLTGAIAARWPEAQPYGGVHDEVVPHLTVAEAAPAAEVERMQDELAAALPLRSVVDHAWLYAFDGLAWSPVWALPLSG